MLVKIYQRNDKAHDLFSGEVDKVCDRGGCIDFVSPWPKKFGKKPASTPCINIRVKGGVTVKVMPMGDCDPIVSLIPPPTADIAENMKDVWAHQAAGSEVG